VLRVILPSVVMGSVVMPSVFIRNVVMPSVVASSMELFATSANLSRKFERA
jgi:hypothetical protein